jgi:F-type H+-transporting ATPase subunit epsilon
LPPVYQLTILAPDHTVFEGRVAGVVAPGSEGYFGVLARHAPMVAGLGPGEFTIVGEDEKRQFFAVSGGYVEWEGVTALVDAAESADAIDIARARAAEERAERRLRSRERDVDTARAETALRRALNRLRVAEKRGGQR